MTPFLVAPFAIDAAVTGVYDHTVPPRPQHQLTFRGTDAFGVGGHQGYDWAMPEGTPILAAGDGRVLVARDDGLSKCGNRWVDHSLVIRIDHGRQADGERYHTLYAHLSALGVQPGDRVTAGQVIGASGNTGCSSGPHLHFAVLRSGALDGHVGAVDPWGWQGADPDPHPASGPTLWVPGREPPLSRRSAARDVPPGLGIRRLAGTDLADPVGGEWVEIGVWPGGAADTHAEGLVLENLRGDRFPLPPLTLRPGEVVRIWTASPGTVSPETHADWRRTADLAWGRTAEAWNDEGDCARLVDPSGALVASLPFGKVARESCPTEAAPSGGEEEP